MAKATEKQIRYIDYLRAGTKWGGQYMNAAWKSLGASMRERSGSVESYLSKLSAADASNLISNLKNQTNK